MAKSGLEFADYSSRFSLQNFGAQI